MCQMQASIFCQSLVNHQAEQTSSTVLVRELLKMWSFILSVAVVLLGGLTGFVDGPTDIWKFAVDQFLFIDLDYGNLLPHLHGRWLTHDDLNLPPEAVELCKMAAGFITLWLTYKLADKYILNPLDAPCAKKK